MCKNVYQTEGSRKIHTNVQKQTNTLQSTSCSASPALGARVLVAIALPNLHLRISLASNDSHNQKLGPSLWCRGSPSGK